MAEKSLLLAVADHQAMVDIAQALGAEWDVTSVSGEADALVQLEERTFDALLVDFNLGSPDGSELLNLVLEKHPETVRFLLAYEADLALVAAKVIEPYQILPKPIEAAALKSRLETGVAPEPSQPSAGSSVKATDASAVPVPAVYAQVLAALKAPGTTPAQIGELIAQDTTLTNELLGLTLSTYLGLPRNITMPGEAVEALGFETVRALVTALQFLAEHRKVEPGYLSFEQLWRHSTNVARMARDLVLFETNDRPLAAEALLAGLLHDLGKVVLVTNFGDLYGRVHSLARKQPVPIWEIEKEIFGANHGEIGGCLIGMWNMPRSVVEAAALHHDPPLGEHDHLDALPAVHIANVLEHELQPDLDGLVPPIMNTALLNELGLLERLPVWRAAIAKPNFADTEPAPELAELDTLPTSRAALEPALPPASAKRGARVVAPTRTTTSAETRPPRAQPAPGAPRKLPMRWVYAGAAAVSLLFTVLWFQTPPEPAVTEPVYARTPAPTERAQTAAATTAQPVLPPSAPAPVAASVSPAPQTTPEAEVPSAILSWPASFLPEPEPAAPLAPPPAVVRNVRPPGPKPTPAPDLRLYGIIYSSTHPCAIVNGKTVFVGDRVNGAVVLGIGPTQVTVRLNGVEKTFSLR